MMTIQPAPAATTADHTRQIHEQGFTLIPGLLSGDQVDAARTALEQVFDEEADIARDRRWLTEAYRVAYMLPAKHETFTTLWDRPDAIELARAVLGQDAVLASFNGMTMMPRGSGQSLHRDHPVPTPGVTLFLNIVCALDRFTPANGATRLVPRSHLSLTPDSATVTADEREEMEARAVRVELEPGDAVAFDAALWHAGSSNSTDGERRALHIFFARPWVQPHWDFPASLPAEKVSLLSEDQRALLGFGNTARRYDSVGRRVVRGAV